MAADGMGYAGQKQWSRARVEPEDGITASSVAERALLSALLYDAAAFEALPEGFGAHHLTVEDYREIFEAARLAAEGGGSRILPTVESMLPHLGGPQSVLSNVAAAFMSARPADVRAYALTVKDMADRRALAGLAADIKAAIETPDDGRQPTAAIINRMMAGLEQIASQQRIAAPAVLIGDAALAAIRAGEAAAARGDGLSGLSIGFGCMDARIGGMEGGSVYILAGRPGSGKTALGLQAALRSAAGYSTVDRRMDPARAKKVAGFSLEMKAPQLGRRALSLVSGVEAGDIRSGRFTTSDQMADAIVRGQQMLAELPLLIEDDAGLTVQAIHLRAKQAKRRLGGLDLLLIDHAHIVKPSDASAKHGPTAGMTEISHGVKWIAKSLDVPVLFLAQLSRGVEGREDKRPNLSDLRQAGAFEEDADVVMFAYREDYYTANLSEKRRSGEKDEPYFKRIDEQRRHIEDNRGKAEIIFEKVRDGEPGTVELRFNGKRTRFYEDGDGEGRA